MYGARRLRAGGSKVVRNRRDLQKSQKLVIVSGRGETRDRRPANSSYSKCAGNSRTLAWVVLGAPTAGPKDRSTRRPTCRAWLKPVATRPRPQDPSAATSDIAPVDKVGWETCETSVSLWVVSFPPCTARRPNSRRCLRWAITHFARRVSQSAMDNCVVVCISVGPCFCDGLSEILRFQPPVWFHLLAWIVISPHMLQIYNFFSYVHVKVQSIMGDVPGLVYIQLIPKRFPTMAAKSEPHSE